MKNLYELISSNKRKVTTKEVEELWDITYSECREMWYSVRLYAILDDDTIVRMRVHTWKERLETLTSLPDNWVEIILSDFRYGRYDRINERVVLINNGDGTTSVKGTPVWFKQGVISQNKGQLKIHLTKRSRIFKPVFNNLKQTHWCCITGDKG